MEVGILCYRDKKEYMRKEENCNSRGSKFILKFGLDGKVLECHDVVMETVIRSSIFILSKFLV